YDAVGLAALSFSATHTPPVATPTVLRSSRNGDAGKGRLARSRRNARRHRHPPEGGMTLRERVAIVFMTLNVMATLVLGGAIAYDFAHRGGTTTLQPVTAGVAGQAYTASPGGDSGTGTPTSGATSGTPTPPSS